MARPRKALVEGATLPARLTERATKLRTGTNDQHTPALLEEAAANSDLSAIVERFKAAHPELWEELALCPLQHGLATMIEKLKH